MSLVASHFTIEGCRSCGSAELAEILAFGPTPIADRLLPSGAPSQDLVAPLTLLHCTACGLSQLRETVAPHVLFGADYPYYSSVSTSLSRHFAQSAEAILATGLLGAGDLVIEAASNDGYMLRSFAQAGVPVLGIDPADGPVRIARDRGIDAIHGFFTARLARGLAADGRRAKVFLANNVLAHVADVNDFVAGIAALLADDGIAVLEAPYLPDLIDRTAFDTIYHQHLLYISVTALVPLFARNGLFLNDVERIAVHGGSLCLTVGRKPSQTPRLAEIRAQEAARGIRSPAIFDGFAGRIADLRRQTRATLAQLRDQGLRVAGYGAAAKAATLLHVFGLGRRDIDVIYDRSIWKHGLSMPGTGIPIVSPDLIPDHAPDAIVLLAWNLADEIIAENRAFTDAGGRFIIPVPQVRMISQNRSGAFA